MTGKGGWIAVVLLVGWLSSATAVAEQKASMPQLEGYWILEATTASTLSSPSIGEIPSLSTVLSIVEIRQRGQDLRLQSRTCDVRLDADTSMVTTRVPRRFIDAIEDRRREARLIQRDGQWYLYVERDWELLGVEMEDPTAGDLPDDEDDPRIIDQDDNGHPGMTIELEGRLGGEVHIVRRSWDQMMGRIDEKGRIRGAIQWDFEQKTVDASRRWLRTTLDGEPDPDGSRFRMQRHDGGETPRCRDLYRGGS